MSRYQVALMEEQGVKFAVVRVPDTVVDSIAERERVGHRAALHLSRNVVLQGEQRHGACGHANLIQFLASVDPSQLPWREMEIPMDFLMRSSATHC
jgi:hypothetical protein